MTFANNKNTSADLGGLSPEARELLAAIPGDRDGRSEWMQWIAKDPEIAFALGRSLGLPLRALDEPFPCIFHPSCQAALTQGRNKDVVYRDPMGGSARRVQFHTLPAIRAARATGIPTRLSGIAHIPWRVRLLHEADMLALAEVAVPSVPLGVAEHVRRARDGFKHLVECRWWLHSGIPVPFTRSFVATWCELLDSKQQRHAIETLIRLGVITKVDAISNGMQNPTHLYVPGHSTRDVS